MTIFLVIVLLWILDTLLRIKDRTPREPRDLSIAEIEANIASFRKARAGRVRSEIEQTFLEHDL